MITLRSRGNDAWDVRGLDTTPVQRENPAQRHAGRSRAGTAEMDFKFVVNALVAQDNGFSVQ